jgi:hypothetical protein
MSMQCETTGCTQGKDILREVGYAEPAVTLVEYAFNRL